MKQEILKVDKDNYHMFDDMIFYREHERYKNAEEQENRDFAQQYAILDKGLLDTYAMKVHDKFVGYTSAVYIPKIGIAGNNGFYFVDDLWVNPSYRRMGIAEKLLQKVEDTAKEKGYYGLRLYVNTENDAGIALYEKCGYGDIYGTAMLMQKVL